MRQCRDFHDRSRWLVYVKVTTGISDDDYIEVKSGLQEGDTIAYDNSSVSATDFYSTMMVSAEGGDE